MSKSKTVVIPPVGRQQLTPLNAEQADYLTSLQTSDQVFAIGKAGTGKTFMPSAYAADLLISGKVRTLRLCRPAVAAGGERLGFLPGDLNEKLAPWTVPIVDVLRERLGKANVLRLMDEERIVTESFEYMRGRTWDNSFILLDEAQNTTVEQMKLFLTRTGKDSQLVVTGDLAQSDLRHSNGLAYAIDLIDELELPIPIVQLRTVERSDICAMWSDAIEKAP